jgi:hypothetical protein
MSEENNFEIFWQTYPLDLCTRRGSKKKAQQIWDKLSPDMYSKIITNLRELIRSDRDLKKRNEFVARWPHVVTWLNQERWQDIQDVQDYTTRPKIKSRGCKRDGCKGDMEHASGYCWKHFDEFVSLDYRDKMQALANENARIGMQIGAGETKESWHARCRKFCVDRGYRA